MQLIVMVFVFVVLLGAVAIQIKVQTVVWQALVEELRSQPRWMIWLLLGIALPAAIAGLTLGFVYDWPR